jgi:hypothetical protein
MSLSLLFRYRCCFLLLFNYSVYIQSEVKIFRSSNFIFNLIYNLKFLLGSLVIPYKLLGGHNAGESYFPHMRVIACMYCS